MTELSPPLTPAEFGALTAACDGLLAEEAAPIEWIATPWPHVLSHHPAVFDRYADVLREIRGGGVRRWPDLRGALATGMMLARSAAAPPLRLPAGPFDVVMISRAGSSADLDRDDDLMFGDLQRRLAERRIRSLALLRNHTGLPYRALAPAAHREGAMARALLPDDSGPAAMSRAVAGITRARALMRRSATRARSDVERLVRREAARRMRTAVVAEGLRLMAQVAEACRASRPRLVLLTYEGHAWEKCAAAGALACDPRIRIVGYQHTLMWPTSHAPLRRIRTERAYDPDLVLTSGDVTRRWLASSRALAPTEVRVLGSYRRPRRVADRPSASSDILVLPDGFRTETTLLFRAAIEAARSLPDVRVRLRPHPALPFSAVASDLPPPPGNVDVSAAADLDTDLARSGAVLYRGSSTVMTAVLAGARPYYLDVPGEMTIDLLAEVDGWRERVRDGRELAERHRAFIAGGPAEWGPTRAYCDRSLAPIDDAAVASLAALARATDADARPTMDV